MAGRIHDRPRGEGHSREPRDARQGRAALAGNRSVTPADHAPQRWQRVTWAKAPGKAEGRVIRAAVDPSRRAGPNWASTCRLATAPTPSTCRVTAAWSSAAKRTDQGPRRRGIEIAVGHEQELPAGGPRSRFREEGARLAKGPREVRAVDLPEGLHPLSSLRVATGLDRQAHQGSLVAAEGHHPEAIGPGGAGRPSPDRRRRWPGPTRAPEPIGWRNPARLGDRHAAGTRPRR